MQKDQDEVAAEKATKQAEIHQKATSDGENEKEKADEATERADVKEKTAEKLPGLKRVLRMWTRTY